MYYIVMTNLATKMKVTFPLPYRTKKDAQEFVKWCKEEDVINNIKYTYRIIKKKKHETE